MELFGFETIEKVPGIYSPELDILAVSDLHLGLEGSMTFDGNYFPKHQLEDLIEDIVDAKEATGASRILVNGDLKNDFYTSRHSEKDEIKKFLGFLDREFEETIVIKGNHDAYLESIVEDYGIEMRDYHLEEGFLFTHGHISIDELEAGEFSTVIIGHEHPALALEDEIGTVEKVSCILYGTSKEGKNVIVLPAFSSMSGGSEVNRMPQRQLLSPLLREGIEVGKMKAIAVSREAGLFEFPQLKKF